MTGCKPVCGYATYQDFAPGFVTELASGRAVTVQRLRCCRVFALQMQAGSEKSLHGRRVKQYHHGIKITSTAKSAKNTNGERPLRPFTTRRPAQYYRPLRNKRKDLRLHVFLPDRAVGGHIEHIFPFRQPPHPYEQVNDNFVQETQDQSNDCKGHDYR